MSKRKKTVAVQEAPKLIAPPEQPKAVEPPKKAEPPKNPTVWIACRVKGSDCQGNQAEMLPPVPHRPLAAGSFVPEMGGKSTRYRCLTCKRQFVINT